MSLSSLTAMNPIRVALLVAILVFALREAGGIPRSPWPQSPEERTQADRTLSGGPCLFDAERGEVPNCLRRIDKRQLFISQSLLKELNFDSHGVAPVYSPAQGWMYADRSGKIVVKGVPAVDNGADSFHDGLVRFIKDGKYGFANRKGRIAVPPIYDGAMSFAQGRAEVCNHCQNRCADAGCEHHIFAGGERLVIDTNGRVVDR